MYAVYMYQIHIHTNENLTYTIKQGSRVSRLPHAGFAAFPNNLAKW